MKKRFLILITIISIFFLWIVLKDNFFFKSSPEGTSDDPIAKSCIEKGIPKKLISGILFSPATSFVLKGDLESFVFLPPYSEILYRNSIWKRFFPEIWNKKEQSYAGQNILDLSLETILKNKIDCVLIWQHLEDKKRRIVDLGIPIEVFDYRPLYTKGIDASYDWIRKLGRLWKREDRAEKIVQWQKQWQRWFLDQKESQAFEKQSKRSLVYLHKIQGLEVTGTYSYSQKFIELIGAKNPVLDLEQTNMYKWANFSIAIETLFKMNPDFIFINNREQIDPEYFYKSSRWSKLKAVQKKQVYRIPMGGYRWDGVSHESPFMWIWMAKIVYPELYQFIPFRHILKEMMSVFSKNQIFSDEDIDFILLMDKNEISKDYRKIFSKENPEDKSAFSDDFYIQNF